MSSLSEEQLKKLYNRTLVKLSKHDPNQIYSKRLILLTNYQIELKVFPHSFSEALSRHCKLDKLNQELDKSLLEETKAELELI